MADNLCIQDRTVVVDISHADTGDDHYRYGYRWSTCLEGFNAKSGRKPEK
jgi:hypothetical protein